MGRKTLVFVCLLVIALMVASTVPVGAKRPPKDPPGDGSDPTGTIYYYQYDEVDGPSRWTMDADGGNKQQLSFWRGSISLTKHKDDHYWHVYFKKLEDTHPDGIKKTELRAVRDDGTGDCQLWYDETMVYVGNTNGGICWMSDDAYISWVTWKIATDGSISDQGVYKASMSWGNDDNTPSLGTLVKAYGTTAVYDDFMDAYRSSGVYPSWSADGSKLLFSEGMDGHVLVDFSTTPITVDSYDYIGGHGVSPDGTKMFFAPGSDELIVMDIDGENQETIYSVGEKRQSHINFGWMYWSPDSNYIVFTQYVFHSQTSTYSGDIYTIGVDGSDKAKLTKKTPTCDWYLPLAWR